LSELQSFDELKYVSPQSVESWSNSFRSRVDNPDYDPLEAAMVIDNRMRILRAHNDRGARILMGTDAPQQFSVPGFSLHREIRRMVEAGMTPYEVIQSGSVNVGAYFANEDNFGTITQGKRADMLLVEGNPLADVANVENLEGVMVRGRWLPRTEIDATLAEIAARHR
jgi:imidazolonepropionase-like amidohydrolase